MINIFKKKRKLSELEFKCPPPPIPKFQIYVNITSDPEWNERMTDFLNTMTDNNIEHKLIPQFAPRFCIETNMTDKEKVLNIYDNIYGESKFLTFEEYIK